MDIGIKIKNARTQAKLTQEDVAEALGVSRQTISNWENEKSYPDIISVLKMSDLYSVSLDYLLKGEAPMSNSNYINYLDESTNTVKSKNNFSKLILLLSYLIIWAVGLIFFWFSMPNTDAAVFSITFLWFVLPVTTFILSVIIGKRNYWGKLKWFSSIIFGIMYMLAEYASFSTANMVSFNKINMPSFGMILAGAAVSSVGLLIGHIIYKRKNK